MGRALRQLAEKQRWKRDTKMQSPALQQHRQYHCHEERQAGGGIRAARLHRRRRRRRAAHCPQSRGAKDSPLRERGETQLRRRIPLIVF